MSFSFFLQRKAKLLTYCLCLISFFLTLSEPLTSANVYFPRFHTLANGGISFTGNTLGLTKLAGKNDPGTSDSDGAFTITDSSQSAPSTTTPWPTVAVPPAGTTLTWQNNSSMAVLDLPPGSTVLYAELIWMGSYGFQGQIPYPGNPFIPDVTSVTLITPQNVTHSIAPDPATAQVAVTPGFTASGNYTRSQNVTSIVQASGAGEYIVGGVPGTISGLDDTHNAAGWTLAVVYSNPNMYTSDLTLFVCCEQATNSTPATISGFCAPPQNPITARLFLSAIEGDSNKTGDQMKFNGTAVSGPNNLPNNFFASQLNTIVGTVVDVNGKLVLINPPGASLPDKRGTFGLRNATPGTDTFAGRQAIDITSVDVSSLVPANSTSATVQGTTSGDDYTLTSFGLQIQVGAPILAATKKVNNGISYLGSVGEQVDFNITIQNVGTAEAFSIIFTDILQTGLSYVPGTFKINNVLQPDPNLNTGVSLGNLLQTQSVTIDFMVQINDYPLNLSVYENQVKLNYEFIPCSTGTIREELLAATNIIQINFLPVANPDFGTTYINTPFTGASVLDNDIGTGITVTSNTAPTQGGTVTIFPDGTYLYTPPLNFVGTDTFTYTITDSLNPSHTSTTTVTIDVLPSTVPPHANDDSGTTAMNTPLNGPSVLANDIGDGLIVISNTQSVEGGTVTVNPDGTYTYVPPLNYVGLDTFTYTAEDIHGNQVTATVTITVTPAVIPYANNDDYITKVNVPVSGNVLLNDSPSLTAYVSNTPPSHGVVVFDPLNNGNFTYTPDPNFIGRDTFIYTATDAIGNLVSAIVTIDVYPDITPVANPDTGTTPVNTTLHGSSVLSNDVGIDLHVVSYTQGINGGTVVVNVDGTYTYTPPTNFVGVDVFTYTAEDLFGEQVTTTVTITVTPLAPPSNFVGVLEKCKLLSRTEYTLIASWTPSPSPSVVAYLIYNGNTLVATVPATGPYTVVFCNINKHQASDYTIVAVDQNNAQTSPLKIRITYE